MIQILAISGSLRAASSNLALLKAATYLEVPGVSIKICEVVAQLPLFNPDLNPDDFPLVREFRNQLVAANLVLISSPEYAHGVPGALKNALDWVVATGEFMSKPVAFLYPSARGTYMQASLAEIIRVMDARVLNPAGDFILLAHDGITAEEIAANPIKRDQLTALLAKYVEQAMDVVTY